MVNYKAFRRRNPRVLKDGSANERDESRDCCLGHAFFGFDGSFVNMLLLVSEERSFIRALIGTSSSSSECARLVETTLGVLV